MRSRILYGVLVVAAAGLAAGLILKPERPTLAAEKDDEAAIQKATEAYTEAFNKGDVKGVVAIWTDDAEYIDDMGTNTKGRAALTALFQKAFDAQKGAKVKIKTSKLRFLKSDIALQDGACTITDANGDSETCPFTAVWMKKEDENKSSKWMLQLVRELPSPAADAAEGPHSKLKDLDWLVGEWSHTDKDVKTTINGRWMKGGKFLILDLAVSKSGEETMSLIQVVGYDPTGDRLHSWVFDTRGGFGEGYWWRKGTTWTAEVAGITADGRHGEGTHLYKHMDDDTFVFEGINREINGEDLPDVKVTYQRVKKSK